MVLFVSNELIDKLEDDAVAESLLTEWVVIPLLTEWVVIPLLTECIVILSESIIFSLTEPFISLTPLDTSKTIFRITSCVIFAAENGIV